MPDEGDGQEFQDLETICALCGRPLNANNRSAAQNDLCKMCAGEQDDLNDDFDIK